MGLANASIFLADDGSMSSIFMFAIIGAIFLFVVILPARKEKKQKEEMVASLKKGDRVLLQCGLIGKIAQLKDETVVLDIDGTKMPFLRNTVANKYVEVKEGASEDK